MLIVTPDFDRRIDLPGPGPCPRPVDIDRSTSGLATLVSLRVYSFARDMVIDGEAEDDEVFIVLMRGRAAIAADDAGKRVAFSLRTDGGSRAVYLPPHAAYRLTAIADCDIAYARAQPSVSQFPQAADFAPVGDRLDIADHAVGMELVFATLPIGGDLPLGANDGRSPERFVHVRSDEDGTVAIGGETLGDWDSAVLSDGESAALTVKGGAADILTISASAH